MECKLKNAYGLQTMTNIFFANSENTLTSLQANYLLIPSIMETFQRLLSNYRKR